MIQVKVNEINKSVTSPQLLTILNNISLTINAGTSVALMGASGAGKTTLLGLLAGLDVPSAGDIFWNEEKISNLSESERAAKRLGTVGFVFQNFQLLPHLTALENVMLALSICGKKNEQHQATAVLTELGLKQRLHHYPQQLSGGEQQRVALARAFVIKPKLLIADEPTGNLDWQSASLITEILNDFQKNYKTTLILATHARSLAESCDQMIEIENGNIRHND